MSSGSNRPKPIPIRTFRSDTAANMVGRLLDPDWIPKELIRLKADLLQLRADIRKERGLLKHPDPWKRSAVLAIRERIKLLQSELVDEQASE